MIALSPEAYRALMESGQAAADRCTLEAAGLFVTPLPPSLMRLVDEDNVFYAREPEAGDQVGVAKHDDLVGQLFFGHFNTMRIIAIVTGHSPISGSDSYFRFHISGYDS